MPSCLKSIAFCLALVLVGVAGGFHLRAHALSNLERQAPAAQTPAAPAAQPR